MVHRAAFTTALHNNTSEIAFSVPAVCRARTHTHTEKDGFEVEVDWGAGRGVRVRVGGSDGGGGGGDGGWWWGHRLASVKSSGHPLVTCSI